MRALTSVLVLLLAAAPAAAGTPRGPAFGNVRYRTAITTGSVADTDDYVTDLIAGETLSVAVAADRGEGLRPVVVLLDPDGTDRTPALRANRTGTSVSFAKFPVDRTGRWVVRVSGAGGTAGGYAAKFRVTSVVAHAFRRQALGGGEPTERAHAFDAVDGALLTAVLRRWKGSTGGDVTAIVDPSEDGLPFGAPKRKGLTSTLAAVPLAGAAGAYSVVVGLDEGAATYDLTLRVAPPPRPRGTVVLSPDEPKLTPLASPLRGNSSQVIELTGANFSSSPLPTVWFGDLRASVLQVSGGGSRLAVQPPKSPEGAVVEVAVVNPDGQAVVRDAYFEYAVPEPPRLSRISPGTASVYTGGVLTYSVALTKPAPGGANVAIELTGAVGTVPPAVTVPSGGNGAGFTLVAAGAPATGKVRASYDGVTIEADVSVVARPGGGGGGDPPLPDEVDVGGWTVVQTNSARAFTIPAGTRLRQGETIVIGRAAPQASFEAFWGVAFGTDVLYLTNDPANSSSSSDDWPSVNGGESYELRDASGATVDGPTPAMGAAGGENWQRTPGAPAGSASSWTVSTNVAAGGSPTPGTGPAPGSVKHGVFLREFSDAGGSGAFVFEFVEIHFDGHAP